MIHNSKTISYIPHNVVTWQGHSHTPTRFVLFVRRAPRKVWKAYIFRSGFARINRDVRTYANAIFYRILYEL